MPAFRVLAALKGLRGTPFDPFGHGAERRAERRLIADYETDIALVLERLQSGNHAIAVELARLPEQIRGFGPVKAAAIRAAGERACQLRTALAGQNSQAAQAAE